MPPKKPSELKEQVEKQNREQPPSEGHDRTAEGEEVPRPTRDEFFGNLGKAADQRSKT